MACAFIPIPVALVTTQWSGLRGPLLWELFRTSRTVAHSSRSTAQSDLNGSVEPVLSASMSLRMEHGFNANELLPIAGKTMRYIKKEYKCKAKIPSK